MAFSRQKVKTAQATALAASTSSVLEFAFAEPARIIAYRATPSVAEAAHATQVLDCTFVNAGTDGAGTAALAILTNDSDLPDSTVLKSSAWVAHDIKQLLTNSRPVSAAATDVWDSIAAGQVVKCTVAKAAGTTTGNVFVEIEYVEST